ncbi:hypothetical protein ACQ4PT_036005 [Festuca glaucescens]
MADEAALLLGVPREVEFIRSELQMMQSSAACSDGGCCKDTVRTVGGADLAARHRVADRIRLLKASLEELNQRNQRYNVFAADTSVVVERSQRYNVFFF